MVVVLATMPVTTPEPEFTDAIATLSLLHVPPPTRSLSVLLDPAQIFVVPAIAEGLVLTTKVAVALQPVDMV